MNKCDIIIPIYNAYDYVEKCIESVIINTDLTFDKLILIDDKSPDERIIPLIEKIKKEHSKLNIEVVLNENNLGFVKTVNKGMKMSKNDVLLLNSDTEVPKRWLDKIKECAYSGNNIATVTPLSNNATLVSVPKGLENNDIPNNLTIDEFDKIVEECSYKDYPELPTAHGFCMYIKREVLDLLGYFDEESFGKGYGEENDFSYRCLDHGYRNILCDNTVVFHKESQSFNQERENVIAAHTKILRDRYPEYVSNQELWCSEFPIKYIGDNISYYLNVNNKPNILYIIHDWKTNVGGTTLHALDLIENLKENYNFHVLAPIDGKYLLTSYFGDTKMEKEFNKPFKFNKVNFYSQEYEKMLLNIVKELNISHIHVHHMVGHFFNISNVIKETKINSSITLHDLHSMCPSSMLMYKDEIYCGVGESEKCVECLKFKRISSGNIVTQWRKDWQLFLNTFENVIVPSNDTKNRIEQIYSIKTTVIEHGLNIEKSKYIPKLEKNHNIAFLGVMCNHKGSNELIGLNKIKNKSFNIHLFGKSLIKGLEKNSKNYQYHGKYNRTNLTNLLSSNKIELICLFSKLPETYSYTLNEAIACGIPVLTFDLGAGYDKVIENNLGWTISHKSSANEINVKIEEILSDSNSYNKILKNIKSYKIKSLNKMSDEYAVLYEKNIKKYNKKLTNEFTLMNASSFSDNARLNEILNSTKWKLINKLQFSEKTVKMVRKILRKR